MIDIRDYWRVLVLLLLCVLATLALFGPLGAESSGAGPAGETQASDDPTNLQYGLQLSGGTRIVGSLEGMTAEGVSVTSQEQSSIEREIADELDVDGINVAIRTRSSDTADVELRTQNLTQAEFVAGMNAVGIEATEDDIREGVTSETRQQAVNTLTERIDRTGLGGSSITTVSTATGRDFILVEVPGEDRESVEELIGDEGQVQIIAGFPEETENGTELALEEALTQEDFTGIEPASQATRQQPSPHVPVSISSEAAGRYVNLMQDGGFTREGIGLCDFNATAHDGPREGQYCLYTVVDGEYVYGASMSPDLAQTINSGQFEQTPSFILQTKSFEEAQELEVNLQAGALPAEFNIESASFISASRGQSFKSSALLIGMAAWITVAIVCYIWYRDVRVSIPMFLTASSEVFLLLGFAAAFGMALDLSHIAGLIAVIGTGVDDLIIMADEILQRKEKVQTGRVFQNRFRKAFWVIGMAAGTTIIAMSPLAVLSLGDLKGFAIITIIGVIIGVAVTRPAYGDVLRTLMLDDVKRS